MKKIFPFCFLLMLAACLIPMQAQSPNCDLCVDEELPDSLIVSDPVALFDSMPQPAVNYDVTNLSLIPKVFSGYEKIQELPKFSNRELKYSLDTQVPLEEDLIDSEDEVILPSDSIGLVQQFEELSKKELEPAPLPSIMSYTTPQWLNDFISTARWQENTKYSYMIENPEKIEYAYWDLPVPPVLLEEDRSFLGFLSRQEVPEVDASQAVMPEKEIKKIHWLHKFGAQLQFSQAYVSPNWYQGGNNYLSLLFGFNWNVQLNQVYHPNLLFQSDLQYKMALTSNPSGYKHKYTIAEDNFQYNLNTGLKAAKDWYYSFNLQFKTQLLNNYEQDSYTQTAAFLSPGDLNMGLGMSYNHKNKLGTFQYTLTISPLSYNLKTCISNHVNHETYSIAPDKKTKSEIGSNVEFVMDWKITTNISYKTRVFMFTDYKYFLADWQNTFNFEINKFLSTQLFVHLRYDGSIEPYRNWKRFMMREILSFGLSYTFSTKP